MSSPALYSSALNLLLVWPPPHTMPPSYHALPCCFLAFTVCICIGSRDNPRPKRHCRLASPHPSSRSSPRLSPSGNRVKRGWLQRCITATLVLGVFARLCPLYPAVPSHPPPLSRSPYITDKHLPTSEVELVSLGNIYPAGSAFALLSQCHARKAPSLSRSCTPSATSSPPSCSYASPTSRRRRCSTWSRARRSAT